MKNGRVRAEVCDAKQIVLKIAEGAGEFSKDEKQRFYRIARPSSPRPAT
jgi:hypothetical protein